MSDLSPFTYNGVPVRVVRDDAGEPWFVAADVCAVLEHSNSRMVVAGLDDDERGVRKVDTPSGVQSMVCVSEAGLYGLVIRSHKAEAKAFRRWVTHEVLPSIRRTGGYGQPARPPTRRELAQMVIEEEERAERAEAKAAALAPAAAAWENLADAAGDYALRDAAQILDRDPGITTGQNRLGRYLRQIGWLDSRGIPYQRHVDCGRLRSRARTYSHPRTGEQVLAEPQVRITAKGLGELHSLLGGTRPLDLDPPPPDHHLTVV